MAAMILKTAIYSSKRMTREMENKEYNMINNSHESLMA
jgi:hypothetical protein